MDDTMPLVNLRIREQRLLRGWTQAEIAARLGITRLAYGHRERTGDADMSTQVVTLYEIAAAIGCDVRDLLPLDES